MLRTNKKSIGMKNQAEKTYCIFFTLVIILLFFVWGVLLCNDPTGLQRNVFFSDRNDWLMDFYNNLYYSRKLQPYSTQGGHYLPFVYVIFHIFSKVISFKAKNGISPEQYSRYSQFGGIFCALYMTVSVVLLFYILYKAFKGKEFSRIGFIIALSVSGIMLYNYDRANTIIITAAFLFLFIYSLDSQSNAVRQLGLVSLAVASAFKVFPCFFAILLLYKKQYKEFLRFAAYFLILAIVPFFFLKGGFNVGVGGFIESITRFCLHNRAGGVYFGIHGKTIFDINTGIFARILDIAVCAASLLFAKYLKEGWKKILLITLSMIMMPGTQIMYSAIYLFYPIVMFFNEKHRKTDFLYVICFILILMPVRFSVEAGIFVFDNFRVINTIFIILTLILTAQAVMGYMQAKKSSENEADDLNGDIDISADMPAENA